jgi:hypothetical protein
MENVSSPENATKFKKLRKKTKPKGWDESLEAWIKDNNDTDQLSVFKFG